MLILNGKQCSEEKMMTLNQKIKDFKSQAGREPHLVVVLVGQNLASQVYVRNKIKSCEKVGMKSTLVQLSETITQKELNQHIIELNNDENVDGILVQLPLPLHLSDRDINEIINPKKDVDGFSFSSLGYLWAGLPFVAPCTPKGVMTLLDHYKIKVEGKNVVVVGRSLIVGKPMAHLMTEANATVTICHSKTINLRKYTTEADIVIVAAGKKHFLGKEDFKKGVVVVDVGMHGSGQGKGVTGDVRIDELNEWALAVTPVPGGVGPMTIYTLLENTLSLATKRLGLKS